LTRARKRIDERRPRYDVSRTDAEKIVAPFLEAVRNGDLATLLASMAENVVLVADGGGKPGALLQPIHGAEHVARAMIAATRKFSSPQDEVRRATVNGLPGVVRFRDGRAQGVLALGIAGGRIQAVFVIGNPDKLRHLNRPSPDTPKQP
jgi:RNA polymerase sigma-70 factor (ECF subfamily)